MELILNSVIRINDLRNPVLTAEAREALDQAERNPVELNEKAVLDAACNATGLNDFGSEDFRPRLRNWLRLVEEDDELTALGRSIKFQQCVHFASSRLRLRKLLYEHPEIKVLKVDRPIIIVGLWRSGTTHLHGLLGADRRLRSLRYRELSDPLAVKRSGSLRGQDAKQKDVENIKRPPLLPYLRTDLLPLLSSMHPLEPDDVAEDAPLQGPDFPLWHDDDEPLHFDFLKTMLKVLQWKEGPNRWVLKTPEYTNQLGNLVRAFPDATIVMTHRDPVDIIASMVTRMAYSARLDYYEVDTEQIASNFVDRVERMLKSALRDRNYIPNEKLIDVSFKDFMNDDIGTVKHIYHRVNMEINDDWRSDIESYRSTHARYKNGKVLYDLRRNFSLSPDEIRERFQFYYSEFPAVKVEAK